MNSFFVCPVCRRDMIKKDNSLTCSASHCFDLAKEGYVHLLPVNRMHSKVPGDTKEMIASRRSFLEGGWYDVFSNAINDELTSLFSDDIRVLDVGCGEGYYTQRLLSAFKSKGIKAQIAGFDISKFAVKAAAKKYKDIEFAVASAFEIPVKYDFCDCVINVFAPIVPQELRRVMKKGGYLLIAVPGERHLFGLKEIVYDEPYENEMKHTEYEGFEFIKRICVKDDITINDNKTICDLFSMTPYFWKTSVDGSERVRQAQSLSTQIHFDLLLYRAV